MIYEFDIQNSIEAAISGGCSMPPVYFGALSLVHTSSGIRKESRNAMRPIASRQWRNDPETQVEGFSETFLVWMVLAEPRSTRALHS